MDLRLASLVTGGSRGLGRSGPEVLRAEGVDVLLSERGAADVQAATLAL
jgi:NAD(P)-dependent dehydrogenase (short-subunit alcohol dehydrogenase family)